MNNIEKNTYVKKQITEALIKLLETKSLSEISISDLTNAAEVGRVSFYRNYASKEDVLREESKRLLSEWGNLFEEMDDDVYRNKFLTLFDFYKTNSSFYTLICRVGLSDIILDNILATAKITPDTANLEAYLKSFWAYGIYGWVIEWINRGMVESGEEIFNLFQAMNPTDN